MYVLTALVFLISMKPAKEARQKLSIHVFTSEKDDFFVNSVILEGKDSVMLVDAQLDRFNALKVISMIKRMHKDLSLIYITHSHPDHYLGLDAFKDAFPKARVIAIPGVVDSINNNYQSKLNRWQTLLGDMAATRRVPIEKFYGSTILFQGTKIKIIKDVRGDNADNSMLWIPRDKTLIAGDVIYQDMHVYTAETNQNSRIEWLEVIRKIKNMNPRVVINGHQKQGTPIGTEGIAFTDGYLRTFDIELKKAPNKEALIETMKRRYPAAGLLLSIERGAKANLP
jgi:glyoxylase-like metal-dependent hydrolase (beta-lactamase superfamily II)